MRADLTANFLAALSNNTRTPIQLMVIHFESGDEYFSDRDIVINGKLYKGVVENWGELGTVGEEDGVSGTMTNKITIWDGGADPFSLKFLSEDPINIFVDLYQTFEGLAASDIAHIGEFTIQDPIESNESTSLLSFDLVTTNMRYFGQVGEFLTREKYPNALESDLNKTIDLIVGNAGEVKCLCSDKPANATLKGSILKNTIKIDTNENLSELGFLPSGYIQIDDEIIIYSSRTATRFNVHHRGYLSISDNHSSGSQVIQANKKVTYIVGQGPISQIKNIKVGGQTPTATYSIHTNTNPAKIVFNTQPTFVESFNSVLGRVFFDATDHSANNAINAHFSYDEGRKSDGAVINKNNTTLAIKQVDNLDDHGEILNVFLDVTHWATKNYTSGAAWVSVEGIPGNIGRLSRPNEFDDIDIDADTDIDHPHLHSSAVPHGHTIRQQPVYNANVTKHSHSAGVTQTFYTRDNTATGKKVYPCYSGAFGCYSEPAYYNPPLPWENCSAGYVSGRIYVNCSQTSVRMDLILPGGGRARLDGRINRTFYFDISQNRNPYFIVYNLGAVGAHVHFFELGVYAECGIPISKNRSSVYPVLTVEASNNNTGGSRIKDINDVSNLSTSNRNLNIKATQKSTKTVTESFDVTDYLQSVDWSWFSDRTVKVRLQNEPTNVNLYITYVGIRVEYNKRIIKATDDVTCEVVGTIENRPDAVVQYLLTEKAGVPESSLGSVLRAIPKWNDLEIWDDMKIWTDEGQVIGVPAGAKFEQAASWFNYRNYRIDGIFSGDTTVKDAIQNLTWQTRSKLLWQNGKAQLVILRKSVDWLIAKDFDVDDIQISSINIKKSNSSDIVNKIDLFYTINRLSGATGSAKYNSTAYKKDLVSISKHGERTKNDLWLFDLVRNTSMANHVSDYYLWQLGESSTYYQLNAYLNSFDVEKEDYITINSNHLKAINKLPVTIKELVRIFGSGKLKQINLLKIVGQSIRHHFFNLIENSNATASDSLNVLFGFNYNFEESVNTSDSFLLTWNVDPDDTQIVSDFFESIIDFRPKIEDSAIINDLVTTEQKFDINDSIQVEDSVDSALELCFGACGFGCKNDNLPFGAKTVHIDTPTDTSVYNDILSMDINSDLTDTLDSQDNLIFSDCFGAPTTLGDCFSNTPFGN